MNGKTRIVILGGGFGGIYTAMYLERALGRRDDFEITLVNKENYFVFQPMLAEVVSGSVGLTDIVSPIRRLLKRTNLHVREIQEIDLENRTISLSQGFRPHPHIIEYDHLVFALGNVTDFRGLRGLPEHARRRLQGLAQVHEGLGAQGRRSRPLVGPHWHRARS